jgi:hypothetical protein
MNSAATNVRQSSFRVESDSLGEVNGNTVMDRPSNTAATGSSNPEEIKGQHTYPQGPGQA